MLHLILVFKDSLGLRLIYLLCTMFIFENALSSFHLTSHFASLLRPMYSPVPRTQKPPENIDGDLDSANPSDSESDTSESDARDNKPLAPGIESKLKWEIPFFVLYAPYMK